MGRKNYRPGSEKTDKAIIPYVTRGSTSGVLKGSPASEIPDDALADAYDVVVHPKYTRGREGTRLYTSIEIPALDDRTGYTASKAGNVITAGASTFVSGDVGNFFVFPGSPDKHYEITTYVSDTQVQVNNSSTAHTSTAGCYLRGATNLRRAWHKTQRKWIFMWGNQVYVADVAIPLLTRCSVISNIKLADSVSNYDDFDNNTGIIFNANGMFKIELSYDPPIVYQINIPTPEDTILDEAKTVNSEFNYHYVYSAMRLKADEQGAHRLTPKVIELETGSNKWDVSSYRDYADVYTDEPVGDETETFDKVTCNYLPYPYNNVGGWQALAQNGSFKININGLGTKEIVVSFANVENMNDVAAVIQSAMREFFADASCEYDDGRLVFTSGYWVAGTIVSYESGTAINTVDIYYALGFGYENAWSEVCPQFAGETRIYCLAVFENSLYGGTYSGGKLYRLNTDGDAWEPACLQLGAETRIYSLCVFNDRLYGGTAPNGLLYRLNEAETSWELVCNQLNGQTDIHSLCVYNNRLYGGTAVEGRLFRLNEVGDAWEEVCLQLGAETHIYSLCVFNDRLYGGTAPNGLLYRLNEAETSWELVCDQLNGQTDIHSLCVYNNRLYGGTYGGGRLFRLNEDGDAWEQVCAQLNSQTGILSLAVYNNRLYGGTGAGGRLFRLNEAGDAWEQVCVQLGIESNIYSLAEYNNRLYGGTSPLAKLYIFEEQTTTESLYTRTPEIIGPLYIPEVPNTSPQEYQQHLTHFSVYRTRDLKSRYTIGDQADQLNDPNNLIWVSDLRTCAAFYGQYTASNNNFAVASDGSGGTFEKADEGSVLELENGYRYEITDYVDDYNVTLTPVTSGIDVDSGYVAAAIGNGRVFSASQSGYTVTRSAGDVFTADDVDKPIKWADGSWDYVTDYVSANQVLVATSVAIAETGMTVDPVYRNFNDIVDDDTLETRLTRLKLKQRFWQPMPSSSIGKVTPGLIFTASENQLNYGQTPDTLEYLHGFHDQGYQITKKINDNIQAMWLFQDVLIIWTNSQTWRWLVSGYQYIINPYTKDAILQISGLEIADNDRGVYSVGSIAPIGDGKVMLLTYESGEIGWRSYNGYQYGLNVLINPNTGEQRIPDIQNLTKDTVALYDGHSGLTLFGKE